MSGLDNPPADRSSPDGHHPDLAPIDTFQPYTTQLDCTESITTDRVPPGGFASIPEPPLPEVVEIVIAIGNYLKQRRVFEALDQFLDSVMLYKCVGRDARVANCRIDQAMLEKAGKDLKEPWGLIGTGSFYEGMPLEVCSDMDMMHPMHLNPVVLPDTVPDSKKHFLLGLYYTAQGNTYQPAYLRLRIDQNRLSQFEHPLLVRENGSGFISSSEFIKMHKRSGMEAHGPANTAFISRQHPKFGTQDDVPCLVSPCWPLCAQEFFSRPRRHGWPKASLLLHIEQAGCHVVGASHPTTERRDLEWRWSFSVAEKELILSMDNKMASAMCILKAIKKFFWKDVTPPDQPKGFCSYYLKVACLWTAEQTEHFKDTRVIDNLTNVLDWLIKHYEDGKLPHYFIPQQNLIFHLSMETCKKVASALRHLWYHRWTTILSCVTMDRSLSFVIALLQWRLGIIPDLKTPLGYLKNHFCLPSPEPDLYNHLLMCLLRCDNEKAVRVLEEATNSLRPGNEIYFIQENNRIAGHTLGRHIPLFNFLHRHMETASASMITTIPETLVLPIIDKLPSMIKIELVKMYRSLLYRCLGDVYLCLYLHYRDYQSTLIPSSLPQKCYKKAENYYKQGLHLPYPDGWHDKRLSGYVCLAHFYFLNGKWGKAEKMMTKLRPLLEEVTNSEEILVQLAPMCIYSPKILLKLPLIGDKLLYQAIAKGNNGIDVYVNPAILGWYILGRIALRQNKSEVMAWCVRCIEHSVEILWNKEVIYIYSTRVIVDTLRKYKSFHKGGNKTGPDFI